MSTPERTHEQRMHALNRANCVRSKRAELKDDVKHGTKLVTDVLEHPPSYAGKMKVLELLLAVPRMGNVKALKTLGECSISPAKTLGGLSERQRRELSRVVQRARVGTNHANQAPRIA